MPDAAALVFARLGVALALHGRRAIRTRALNGKAPIDWMSIRHYVNSHLFTVSRFLLPKEGTWAASQRISEQVQPRRWGGTGAGGRAASESCCQRA